MLERWPPRYASPFPFRSRAVYPASMPNKRFQDIKDAGQLTRKRWENLQAHPMGLREAIRIICEVHTQASNGPHGFNLDFNRPPDFVKVDGDLYWEAWRVLREAAAGR
jgi:hypothetical protein